MSKTDTIKQTKQLKEKIKLYHHITTSENTDINYDVIYLDTTSQTFINLNVKDKLNFTIKPLKEILKLTNNNPNPKIFLNTLWQYTHPEDKKQLITYSKKTLNHQKTPLFIFRIINPNSNKITYLKRIVTFIDNIAIIKLIDVTTTKNTEILQENHLHEFSYL